MVIGNIPEHALLRYLGYQPAAYLLPCWLIGMDRQIRKRVLVLLTYSPNYFTIQGWRVGDLNDFNRLDI